MARYRAKAALYIRRLITAGEEFESELQPSRNWEPLDDAAKAAVEKYQAEQGKVLQLYQQRDPAPVVQDAIDIPADWASLEWPKKRALAMKLGAQSNVRKADADSFITAELERRSQKLRTA